MKLFCNIYYIIILYFIFIIILYFNYYILHGKNGFSKVSKILAGYKSENNFVGPK